MSEEKRFKQRATSQGLQEQEIPKARGKRKRHETACVDRKRDYLSCRICGSENLIQHGVISCTELDCDAEKYFITEHLGFWLGYRHLRDEVRGLGCNHRPWKTYTHSLRVCVDCGAYEGPLCPNCGQHVWAKGNKRNCKFCGYVR